MLQVGAILANRYELLEVIGSGGMAVVFRGMDHKLHREVAVKVMREDFNDDPLQVEKFRKEAHAIAMLTHPNIVGIYDVGTEQGMEYMVKEYVDGITLKDYIRRRGHMGADEIVKVVIKIAEALKCAHESNIIHRDIKPQNVLVTPRGEVKVTDFGIAKFTKSSTVTDHKDAMGSVHYLSPEQARGQQVDARSDLYSLGITMYEMAVGKPPFDGDTPVAVAMQQLNTPMPSPRAGAPELWSGLETIILGLTRKNPVDRYQNATELIADLKQVYRDPKHGGVAERQTTPMRPEELELKRHTAPVHKAPKKKSFWEKYSIPILGTVLGVLIVVLTSVVITGLMASMQTDTQPGVAYMPSFEGKTLAQAQAEVKENDLNIVFSEKITMTFSDTFEKDTIMGQEPAAGTKIDTNKTTMVTLIVSKGEREVTRVPDYLDNRYEVAVADLVARGIPYDVTVVEGDEDEHGLVVDQSPKAGTELTPDTEILLYVAVAKDETVQVPDLDNKTEAEARQMLVEAGLIVGTVSQSSSSNVKEGNVIAQNIPEGKEVAKGSSVSITISTGAYKDKEEGDGGAFLLTVGLFADVEGDAARITVIAEVGNDRMTLVDKEYNRGILAVQEEWVAYPKGTQKLRVLVDGSEVVNLVLEK